MAPSIIPQHYALANLPRYTSYPTAPQFRPCGEGEYQGWLRQITPADSLSLYLHVPFCRSLCWYCGCNTAITQSSLRTDRYAAALRREIAAVAACLPEHAGVSALHFGGGTPSTLGTGMMRQVLDDLRQQFGFQPGAELAIELDPRTLTADFVALLGETGFQRASLGVQDISAAVQSRIGRVQSCAVVEDAMRQLRAAGIQSINFDLMYGLPGQRVQDVEASARFAAEQGAARVAVFGYAHVPWMKTHQNAIKTEQLPGALERIAQAEAAEAALVAAGYVAIGLDHFALPTDSMAIAQRDGRLHRNFQGYTTDTAAVLLGLGASAIGSLPAAYVQNLTDERAYIAAVEAGHLPVAKGLPVSADDTLRRSLIERVMCDFRLPLSAVPAALLAEIMPALEPLAADGLIEMTQDLLLVTDAGRRYVRHVAACFDAYISMGKARHSAAV